MRRALIASTACASLLLVVGGCGGDGGGAGNDNVSGAASGSSSTHTSSSTTTTTDEGFDLVAWILSLGPSAPTGPPEFRAYELLRTRDCTQVLTVLGDDPNASGISALGYSVYKGAARACLAAQHGRAADWSQAETAVASVQGQEEELGCLDRTAFGVLRALVSQHQSNPGRRIRFGVGSTEAHAPACPTISSLQPDNGVEGEEIRIIGTNLGEVSDVQILDSLGNSVGAGLARPLGGLVITLPEDPPSDASRTVCIAVLTRNGDTEWAAAGRLLTYAQIKPPDTTTSSTPPFTPATALSSTSTSTSGPASSASPVTATSPGAGPACPPTASG